ncbi:MAG: tyrosine-type recombinase/integrase [archaeon]
MSYKVDNELNKAFHMRHINRVLHPEKAIKEKYFRTGRKFKIDLTNELSKEQRNVLEKFFEEKTINKEINLPTLKNKLYFLRKLGIYLKKDWKKVTEDDLKDFLKKSESEGAKEEQLLIYKSFIRQFFQWLYEMKEKEYPKVVDWIKIKRNRLKKKLKEDLITPQEFELMLKHAGNQRDKTILILLRDSGCRIGEIINLKLKNIEFDELGAILKVPLEGKTGERKVRLINSVPDLQLWFNNHPFSDKSDAPLFFQYSTNRYGEPLGWTGFSNALKRIAKRTGVKQGEKGIHAHLFRHFDATEKSQYLTEAEMRIRYGWSDGSPTPSIYTHLDDDAVNKSLIIKLAQQGLINTNNPKIKEFLKTSKIKDIAPQIMTCVRCQNQNPPLTKICNKCGLIFDQKLAMQKQKEEKEYIDKRDRELMILRRNQKKMMKLLKPIFDREAQDFKELQEEEADKEYEARGNEEELEEEEDEKWES